MKPGVILVIRLSAMGDVALTLPVLRSLTIGSVKLVVVTKKAFTPFYDNIPGLTCIGVDTKGSHSGLIGIYRLYRQIQDSYKVNLVVDLHSVIRSVILSFLFRIKAIKVIRFEKGRSEKRKFVKGGIKSNLPHTIERYIGAFEQSGFSIADPVIPAFIQSDQEEKGAKEILSDIRPGGDMKFIGIAPYAKHLSKSWGEENICRLMDLLSERANFTFLLFGGREDIEGLNRIASRIDNAYVIAGLYSIRTELALIKQLEFMVSMDSSNMHLASLSGINTVSIWGGTHPAAGFGAFGQNPELSISEPSGQLDCRPCSVYGRADCPRNENKFRCLSDIKPQQVFDQIIKSGLTG